jgi:hypothetical protein
MQALICSTFLILASGLLLVTAYRSSGTPTSGSVAPNSVSWTMPLLSLLAARCFSVITEVVPNDVACMHAKLERER